MKYNFLKDKYFYLILFLVCFNITLKIPGLNPPSLWLDDLWVALISKVKNFDEFMLVNGPAPIFFTFFQWLASKIFEDKELSMQIVPFTFGTISIPLYYFFVFRFTKNKFLGFLAAAILCINSLLLNYSIRAKQYAVETFFVIALILVFERLKKYRSRKDWIIAFIVSLLTLGFSFNSILVSGFFLNFFAVDDFLKIKFKSIRNIVFALIFDFSFALYYFLFLKAKSNEVMQDFWKENFVNLNQGFIPIIKDIFAKITVLLLNAFPIFKLGFSEKPVIVFENYLLLLLILVLFYFGIKFLFEKKLYEWVVFVLFFYLSLILLSILKLYPLGGVRTDIFTYPITIMIVLIGLERLFKIHKLESTLNLVICIFLIFFFSPYDLKYNDKEDGSLSCVIYLNKTLKNSNILVIPHSTFTMSYYSDYPVEFLKSEDVGTGYIPIVKNDKIFTLEMKKDYWDYPNNLDKSLEIFEKSIENKEYFYVFTTMIPRNVIDYIDKSLNNSGFFYNILLVGNRSCGIAEYKKKY